MLKSHHLTLKNVLSEALIIIDSRSRLLFRIVQLSERNKTKKWRYFKKYFFRTACKFMFLVKSIKSIENILFQKFTIYMQEGHFGEKHTIPANFEHEVVGLNIVKMALHAVVFYVC